MSSCEDATVEVSNEHRWLQKLAGEWTFEGEGTMAPDQPPFTFGGTESARCFGGFWVVAEGRGEMPGAGEATSLLTLGFDPGKGRFVGSFIASMMPNMFVYDGSLDAAGRVLTLETEGPDSTGRIAAFRDIHTLESDDHRVLTSVMKGEDGEWRTFMTAHYRRKK